VVVEAGASVDEQQAGEPAPRVMTLEHARQAGVLVMIGQEPIG
jgi:hypothetical protein